MSRKFSSSGEVTSFASPNEHLSGLRMLPVVKQSETSGSRAVKEQELREAYPLVWKLKKGTIWTRECLAFPSAFRFSRSELCSKVMFQPQPESKARLRRRTDQHSAKEQVHPQDQPVSAVLSRSFTG